MKRPLPQLAISIATLLILAGSTQAQLAVQNVLTPNDLVNNILVGQGVTVSNVMFNGQPANTVNDQVGSFIGTNSNIGLTNGLLLATGKVVWSKGPITAQPRYHQPTHGIRPTRT